MSMRVVCVSALCISVLVWTCINVLVCEYAGVLFVCMFVSWNGFICVICLCQYVSV